VSAVKGLSSVQMRAGTAALALLVCLVLPWYTADYGRVHNDLSAFGAFSWVEAAILVVAGSVLYLLYARSQKRAFHLPGGDGWAVTVAGGWALFLLGWRLFDRPGVEKGSVGVQWGLFVTMLVAAALLVTGQAMRREHKPEPPNPAADDPTWEMPTRRLREPVDSGAVTSVLREDRPAWEGEPPPPPGRVEPVRPKPPPDEGKLF
jgi:hypothetical protein